MTPKEFAIYIKAWVQKEERIDQRLAGLQANIINPWVKRRLKPSDFMPKKAPLQITSGQDLRSEMKRRQQEEEAS